MMINSNAWVYNVMYHRFYHCLTPVTNSCKTSQLQATSQMQHTAPVIIEFKTSTNRVHDNSDFQNLYSWICTRGAVLVFILLYMFLLLTWKCRLIVTLCWCAEISENLNLFGWEDCFDFKMLLKFGKKSTLINIMEISTSRENSWPIWLGGMLGTKISLVLYILVLHNILGS